MRIKEEYGDIDFIISHWDPDGVISACLLSKALGLSKNDIALSTISAGVGQLVKQIKRGYENICLLDLNLSEKDLQANLKKVIKRRNLPVITVIDHHNWSDNSIAFLKVYGREVKSIIEPKYPSTARLLYDKIIEKESLDEKELYLIDIADDDDQYQNQFSLTGKLRVLLRWGDWKERYKYLDACLDGNVWPDWAEELYKNYVNKYRNEIEKSANTIEIINLDELVVAFLKPNEKIHPGDLLRYLEEKRNIKANIYFFLYDKGISIRSNTLDALEIARALGGGGHPKASGVYLEPFTTKRKNIKDIILKIIKNKKLLHK